MNYLQLAIEAGCLKNLFARKGDLLLCEEEAYFLATRLQEIQKALLNASTLERVFTAAQHAEEAIPAENDEPEETIH